MPLKKPVPPPRSNKRGVFIFVALVVVAGVIFFLRNRESDAPGSGPDVRQVGDQGLFAAGPTREKVVSKPFETRGSFVATEVSQLVGRSGNVAIIFEVPDPKLRPTPDMVRFLTASAAEVAAFKSMLKGLGSYTFAPELKLPHPDGANRPVWPPGELAKFIRSQSSGATIVAFCLPPEQMSEDEMKVLRQRSGKFVVVAGSAPDVKPYLDAGVVHLAVTAKSPIPRPTGTDPETPSQWLHRVHEVLRP